MEMAGGSIRRRGARRREGALDRFECRRGCGCVSFVDEVNGVGSPVAIQLRMISFVLPFPPNNLID